MHFQKRDEISQSRGLLVRFAAADLRHNDDVSVFEHERGERPVGAQVVEEGLFRERLIFQHKRHDGRDHI